MNTPLPLESAAAEPSARLVAASAAGDTVAFRALVVAHQGLVTGICYAALGRRDQAEEAAQDTFVTAWQRLATLRAPERLAPWLAGIARHVCQNRLRARATAERRFAPADDAPLADAAPDPARAAIAHEEERIVERALAELPLEWREALVLYYRQEQSTAAVAAALELSEEAVRQRLARGRRQLQERAWHLAERTLRDGAPSAAFAVAVIAALPGSAPGGASIAFSGAAAARTVLAATAGLSLGSAFGWAGACIGAGCGLAGSWFGTRAAFGEARTPGQRRVLTAAVLRIGSLALLYVAAIAGCTFNFCRLASLHPALPWIGLGVATLAYVPLLIGLIRRTNAGFRRAAA